MSREKPEPKWTHDCESCVFLGQLRQRRDSDPIYDVRKGIMRKLHGLPPGE